MAATLQGNNTWVRGTANSSIFTGVGVLDAIIVGATAAGAITLTDTNNGASTRSVVSILKASIVEGTYTFGPNGTSISQGLSIKLAGASDVTVVWRKG